MNNIRYFIRLNSPTNNRHRTRALLTPARNSVDKFQHTFLWCWNIRCIPFIHNHRIHSFGIVLLLYIIYVCCIIVTSRDPYCRYIDKSLIINHHIGQKVALGWALGISRSTKGDTGYDGTIALCRKCEIPNKRSFFKVWLLLVFQLQSWRELVYIKTVSDKLNGGTFMALWVEI